MSPCPGCGSKTHREEYCPDCLHELGIDEDVAQRVGLVPPLDEDPGLAEPDAEAPPPA